MIQEIRDSSQESLPELVDEVNKMSSHNYQYVVSMRTGRSSNKEQYGYIYRYLCLRTIFKCRLDTFQYLPEQIKYQYYLPINTLTQEIFLKESHLQFSFVDWIQTSVISLNFDFFKSLVDIIEYPFFILRWTT